MSRMTSGELNKAFATGYEKGLREREKEGMYALTDPDEIGIRAVESEARRRAFAEAVEIVQDCPMRVEMIKEIEHRAKEA